MSGFPYPGLRPFRKDEADIFFGREEQVDQLLKRLGESRFLAVVGPSGCGKSSLVQTGLLNALETGFLVDAGVRWRIASMRPGNQPMRNLVDALLKPEALEAERGERALQGASALAGISPTVKLEDAEGLPHGSPISKPEIKTPDPAAMLLATLRRGPLGLVEALKETPILPGSSLLLLVDQFEEIFRYRDQFSTEEAEAFVALLLASAQQREVPLYVVITMRTDFLGDCALFTGLPEALNDGQFLTPRLTREQCRQAIVAPARVFEGRVEPALENRLLNDMGTDPDQLPILQHALMRLWTLASQKGKPVTLALSDYETIGGLQEALSRHADEAYGELTERGQKIAEIMFRGLCERSAARRDTRRPVRLQHIADIAETDPEEVIAVAEAFRRPDRSFLTPPAGVMLTPKVFLDISHESLIRQWKKLVGWVEEEAESATSYHRLLETARLWQANKADLWGPLDLEISQEWRGKQDPNEFWAERYGGGFALAMEFLESSRKVQEKKRQLAKKIRQGRNFVIALAVLLVAMGLLFLWAREQQKIALARKLAANAEGQLRIDPQLSVLLAVEAVKKKSVPEVQVALRVALGRHFQRKILQGHKDSVARAAFNPTGKLVVTASYDKTACLWDASSFMCCEVTKAQLSTPPSAPMASLS
jgi:energy-coupling factor transporter ATP-binding protein EcfA2